MNIISDSIVSSGVTVSRIGSSLAIRFPYDPAMVEIARGLPGRRWDAANKYWSVPVSALEAVLAAFPDARLDAGLIEEREQKQDAEARAEAGRAAQLAVDLQAYEMIRESLHLYKHQDVGARWLIERRAGIVADDMGLGKSREALAAARALGYRIIVVAPAGLRVNWLREAEAVNAQIEIYSWAKVPEAIEGDYTLIADEASYAQNLKAQRTKRFLDLSRAAKAVFLLTGTPIKNGRPANLFPLLVAARHDLAKDRSSYERRYCLPPEAPILMADFTERALGAIRVGDVVMGWDRAPSGRRVLRPARVQDLITKESPLIRLTLTNGETILCTPDHKWARVANGKNRGKMGPEYAEARKGVRMMQVYPSGRGSLFMASTSYRRGYLYGFYSGDGWAVQVHERRDHLFEPTKGKTSLRNTNIGCACMDREPLVRVHEYLDSFGLESEICRRSDGLWTIHHHTQAAWDLFASFRLTDEDGDDWHAGLLGGLYDAEGSQYIITQSARRNPETCRLIDGAFRRLGLRHQTYNHVRRHHPEHSVRGFRLLGGRLAFYRFCDLTRPALTRKLSAWLGANAARFTIAHPKILRIETLPGIHRVHTLTTETGNYVAYGMGSKNCNAKATKWTRWDVSGAAHLDELHRKISDVVLRRMKSECLDLPEKTRVLRKVELSAEAQQQYTTVLNEMQTEYRRRKLAGEIQEADTLVLMNHLRHAGSIAKVEAATELAEEVIEQGGQVVLFTAFKESAESLAVALGAGRITGEQNADQRQAAIDKFQAGEIKAMVCTLGAGNVGITLTAAQTVILVDRPWTSGDAIQAEDRLHRIGQQNAVTAIWLQANGADEAIDALLEQKHERIELVLAGKRKTLRGLGSISDVAEAVLG